MCITCKCYYHQRAVPATAQTRKQCITWNCVRPCSERQDFCHKTSATITDHRPTNGKLRKDLRTQTDQCTYNEPVHEISNNLVCATSKASDQPAHTRSLIRACARRLDILWLLSYWLVINIEFLSLKGGCRGLSDSTLVKMAHCWKSHVTA